MLKQVGCTGAGAGAQGGAGAGAGASGGAGGGAVGMWEQAEEHRWR